jgi:predicted NACHT family NTPase
MVIGGDVQGNVTVHHIHNIYQQAPGQPLLDEAAFTKALDGYLKWVVQRYGRLNLRGVEKREQQILSLTLDDVYVSLAAIVTPERKKRQMEAEMLRQERLESVDMRRLLPLSPRPAANIAQAIRHNQAQAIAQQEDRLEPIDMRRLLPLSPRLVITGGPGCGKTTYLHLLAANIARAIHHNQAEAIAAQLGLAAPLPLPIVVSLSDYNRYRRQVSQAHDPRQGTLIAFISYSLIQQQAAIGLPTDFFERLLVQGRSCLLLLDGLDEVANERERVLVRRAVENLAYNDGVRQVVVTSRSRAYQGQAVLPEEFRVAAVQPMSSEQVAADTRPR